MKKLFLSHYGSSSRVSLYAFKPDDSRVSKLKILDTLTKLGQHRSNFNGAKCIVYEGEKGDQYEVFHDLSVRKLDIKIDKEEEEFKKPVKDRVITYKQKQERIADLEHMFFEAMDRKMSIERLETDIQESLVDRINEINGLTLRIDSYRREIKKLTAASTSKS